jgi:PAS domain S-box-containing protein
VSARDARVGVVTRRLHGMPDSDPRIEAALDAVITLDVEGRVVEWNHAAVRMFGYDRGDVMGEPLADLIVPDDLREAHTAALRRCAKSGAGALLGKRVELRAVDKCGRELPVELTVTTYTNGGERLFTAYVRDITDRYRREGYSVVLEAAGRALLEHPRDPEARLGAVSALLVPRFAPFAAVAVTADPRPRVLSAQNASSPALLAHAVLSGASAAPLWQEALGGETGLSVSDLRSDVGAATPAGFLRDTFAVGMLAVCRIAVGDIRAAILCGASDRGFSEEDLRFLFEFCRRTELAVENASVYRAQAQLWRQLQDGAA